MTTWDPVIAAVGEAQQGAEGGHVALLGLWDETSCADHARRCVLAHYLADLEPEVADEVRWDEVALAEHARLADDALAGVGISSTAGMAASLHLNLADGYLRQGRVGDAREQLREGLAAAVVLADDGYGELVRRGLDGVARRLARAETEGRGRESCGDRPGDVGLGPPRAGRVTSGRGP